MSLDQDTINAELELLAVHRRTLAVYLRQHAQLGVLAPPGVANGIAEAQSAIRHIKAQLRTEGVPIIDEPNDDIQPAVVAASSRLSPQEQRNRHAMLTKVKTIWIEGLLEQSLAKELRIALDLTEQSDAVDLPLNALVQELRRPPRPFSAGTPIIQVFDQMGGALLVLGVPGVGKTTLLLELARDLIVRAEQDETHPIPVVFNLSSWSEKRGSLKEWLVEELNTKYDVPRKVAQGWVDTDVILPLLDGLDEMATEHRGNCARVINAYRLRYGLVPLVVCSRVKDYTALTIKLRLQGAIVVQPLTKPQVDDYLERAGERLAGVRVALRNDAVLREMLDTPLMLIIVMLAYSEKSAVEVQALRTLGERQRHLFDAYIAVMFRRRSEQTHYKRQQTTRWLSWLARQMVQHHQTVFYIEEMQPDSLSQQQRSIYVLCIGLLAGLISGSVFGLVLGLAFALRAGVAAGLQTAQVSGLLTGLLFGLLVGLINAGSERIEVVEAVHWSWSKARSGQVFGQRIGSLGGWLVGLGTGLIYGLAQGLVGLLILWVGGVLSIGLVSGLIFGLLGGLSSNEIETKTVPNQGIHRSAKIGLVLGLGVGLVLWLAGVLSFGLVAALVFGLGIGFSAALIGGLIVALGIGLFVGLFMGGRTALQHYTLRWMLYRNGSLPLRLVPFLDYCTERIFLRKVGGGYIFVHRLLMEHLASLYTTRQRPRPNEGAAD